MRCHIFMDDKRDFNAFCGAADVTLCGLPHAEGAKYVPPTAEVMVFALEEGFAATTKLGGQSAAPAAGSPTPAGQFAEEPQYWTQESWH